MHQMQAIRIENQTKIFASMCPDEILDHYDNYMTRRYQTILMLGDISGFTEMTEKYTESGKGGPSKLTEILNSYIGAMVQEILSHNGDVLKFSGDAFIVMWKLGNGKMMRDIASEAIKTACIIQKHFGTYKTEVDVVLRVKFAIASGKTYFTSIGDSERASYYIITGKPVWEVKFAEGLCRGGDILVAPSCWQWVNPSEYIYKVLPDGIHTLIISLSVLWDSHKESYLEAIDSFLVSSKSSKSDLDEKTSSDFSDKEKSMSRFYRIKESTAKILENNAGYSLRPKVIEAGRAKLVDELRSYMLRPVIRSVEIDEPLEYLTEIRQVAIVFVNVVTQEINRKTLIKLVNCAFIFVCSIVGEMQGCVNKTSLFDKDLIFLCIFGLRGDKHELESQIGLRCASKLRRGLIKFQHIKSVSVGVTTGMTYCGVVGHILRREYTVIGMTVNKAARLMCAYVDKVVCDRESFLLSHLEAKHFVLQETKYLKGITNVGPIYEFSEQTSSFDHELRVNKYPLLGHESELYIFRNLLGKMFDNSKYQFENIKKNILIVRGESRMGKTRLMEEMANVIRNDIPVNFISLAPADNQIPYILLRFLFYAPLDITENSILKEKQDKIESHFQGRNDWKLCFLNHIFNVAFNTPSKYSKMDEKNKKKYLKKMVGHLARNCFKCVWVVLIDDAELADKESIDLFPTITKQGNVFFVLSYGNKLSKDYEIPKKILQTAQIIDLSGLDKWFHAALACQAMDVVAIPIELEKIIQERSSGNPGWMENFLVSLFQSNAITIKCMTKKEIQNMGLIMPPEHMLKRISDHKKLKNATSFQKDKSSDRWEMYQFCFRDSSIENTNEFNDAPQIVCTLTSSFILEDIISETTLDTILLKLYDSLTPLDQFLLKCAAVLGEIIDRKMLEKLMEGTSQRDIGLSLVKLFELRIIGCAVGNFSRSPGPAMLFKRIPDRSINVQIRCGCRDIEVTEVLSDLPNYASCGLMRFKLDMFRETTYRLLTENQKVELHSKALRYLQHNTRRCISCGSGQFNRLLGKSMINEIGKKKLLNSSILDLRSSVLNTSEIQNSNENQNIRGINTNLSLFRMCQPLVKSPTRTFSDRDFTNCECNLHLLTAYTHILEHCRGIGVKALLLVAILEFTEVCLSTLNIPQAIKLLVEGDELVNSIWMCPDDELIILPYLKGKIQTLKGRCFLESNLINEAIKYFEVTAKIMRYHFPAHSSFIKLKSYYLLKKQQLMLTYLKDFKVGILDGDAAKYNDQFACCLDQMFIVYRLLGMHEHAQLAAIWGLNIALESSKDFFVLCTSYANMMIVAHIYQYRSIIPYLEIHAINLCHDRKDSIELQELNAIAKLYTRIFFSRWLRGAIELATGIGFVVAKLAKTIQSINLRLIILPRLIQLLILKCRYGEVVPMLQELKFICSNDMDQSGRTWYYALCVDFLLESGISVVTLRECEKFYQQQSSKLMNLKDSEAAKRFFICMWLWYVRIGDWEAATVWRSRKCDEKILDDYTVSAARTMLKKIEGLMICYVHKMDNKNVRDGVQILTEIKKTFKIIDDLQKVVKISHPRYLMMKAYHEMVTNNAKSGLILLRKSKKLAFLVKNLQIYYWANHCEKAWTGTFSTIQEDFWKEQCAIDNKVDWHEVEMQNRKLLPYTLPLPKLQR